MMLDLLGLFRSYSPNTMKTGRNHVGLATGLPIWEEVIHVELELLQQGFHRSNAHIYTNSQIHIFTDE